MGPSQGYDLGAKLQIKERRETELMAKDASRDQCFDGLRPHA